MTILYPEAFASALPASFDGVFHWEYINEVLRPRRRITLTDIDAVCEINQRFLTVETSDRDKEQQPGCGGQQRLIDALVRTGVFAHVDIIGKQIPTRWRWRWRGGRESWSEAPDGRAQIAAVVARWAAWADGLSVPDRDYDALRAAWDNACKPARDRLLDEVLFPAKKEPGRE